jgi:hypothetical protein
VDHDAWWDEICTATRALLPLADLWTSLKYQGPSPVSTDSSPPLSHILIHLSLYFGQSGYFLKLPNSIFGALTIPAVYLLGKRLENSRVGLLAATFIALSSFHVSYSRDARWYSLFYFATVFSFYFFLSALKKNGARQWVGLVFFSVVMLYTSYMAAIFLVSFALSFVVWFCTSRNCWEYKKSVCIRLVSCVFIVLILYAPWVEAQINAYFFLYSDAARPPFSWVGFLDLLRATVSPTYYVGIDTKPIIAGILVLGVIVFIAAKKYFELVTLSFWAVIPLVSAYTVKTVNTISPKYVLFMLFVVALFAALIIDRVAGFIVVSRLRNKSSLQLWMGLCLILGLSYFSIQFYPGHLVEGIHSDKSVVSYLAREKYNSEYMFFSRSRQHKAIADWYLPGAYKQLDEATDMAYRRYLLVSGADASSVKNDGAIVGGFAFSRGGVVNRSPLVIDSDSSGEYVYSDDYHDFKMYTDASFASNIYVSTSHNLLELNDLNKSGEVVYTFVNPSGEDLKQMVLQLNIVLDRGNYIEPDCSLLISVTNSLGEKRIVKSVDAALFPATGGVIDVSSSFDTLFLGRGPVKLSLEFSRGVKAGILGVRHLAVTFRQEPVPGSEYDAVSIYSHNIAEHTALTSWDKSIWPINPPGPYAFSVAQPEGTHALNEFKERYPKAQPIYILKNRLGEAQILYYDPWCEDPFLRLRTGQSERLIASDSLAGGDYVLRGAVDFPVVHSGSKAWPLMLKTPPGVVSTIIPNGQGRLSLRPLFTKKDFSPLQIERYNGIKKLQGEDCLTCSSNSNCQVVYSFQSIFPVQELRVVWYPRLHSDVARKNSVALSVSLDGLPAKLLDSCKSRGTDSWDGPERKVTILKLTKPANRLEVIFDLENDATQIWSVSDMIMTIEAKIDTRTAPGINFADGDQVWVEGGKMNDFGIFFPKGKSIFYDNLEYMN